MTLVIDAVMEMMIILLLLLMVMIMMMNLGVLKQNQLMRLYVERKTGFAVSELPTVVLKPKIVFFFNAAKVKKS